MSVLHEIIPETYEGEYLKLCAIMGRSGWFYDSRDLQFTASARIFAIALNLVYFFPPYLTLSLIIIGS
jgi:hypothetical protein